MRLFFHPYWERYLPDTSSTSDQKQMWPFTSQDACYALHDRGNAPTSGH